jgi:hypothetical protein
MGVLKATAYSILETPVIGYQNLVTASNITTTTAAAGFPASNLANPATHLMWRSTIVPGNSPPTDEGIFIALNSSELVDYVGIAKHNLVGSTISLWRSTNNSPNDYTQLVAASVVADNSPIIFRFTAQAVGTLWVKITPADTITAGVVYVGRLLDLGRGVKADQEHTPLPYGRRSNVVDGLSESGNFLGRVVLSSMRQTKAVFFGFTRTFYASDLDAFLEAAQEIPFFWAWAPGEYPTETGFAWLINADAEPSIRVDTDVRAVGLTLEMRGIA